MKAFRIILLLSFLIASVSAKAGWTQKQTNDLYSSVSSLETTIEEFIKQVNSLESSTSNNEMLILLALMAPLDNPLLNQLTTHTSAIFTAIKTFSPLLSSLSGARVNHSSKLYAQAVMKPNGAYSDASISLTRMVGSSGTVTLGYEGRTLLPQEEHDKRSSYFERFSEHYANLKVALNSYSTLINKLTPASLSTAERQRDTIRTIMGCTSGIKHHGSELIKVLRPMIDIVIREMQQ